MSINDAAIQAVSPIVPDCVPDHYDGDNKEYCVFRYEEIGDDFGDDTANAVLYLFTLNWFLPLGVNPLEKKKQIKEALVNAGFTYPNVLNLSDEEGQHFVFECQCVDGDV